MFIQIGANYAVRKGECKMRITARILPAEELMADTITEGQGDEIIDLLKDVLTELREINSKCDELSEINRKCDEVDKTLDEIKQHAWSIAFEIEHRKNK
jgi:hypothetical protein